MNWTERVSQIANGAKVLSGWLGSGGIPVDKELAQSRAKICLTCPKNVKDWQFLESVAGAIKQQVALKNHLLLRVAGEKQLHTCQVCSCVIKLKVHVPIEMIKPDENERQKFPAFCWLITETKP
jgi:hypothetical protein